MKYTTLIATTLFSCAIISCQNNNSLEAQQAEPSKDVAAETFSPYPVSTIRDMTVGGVSLGTPAREAKQILAKNGYEISDNTSYANKAFGRLFSATKKSEKTDRINTIVFYSAKSSADQKIYVMSGSTDEEPFGGLKIKPSSQKIDGTHALTIYAAEPGDFTSQSIHHFNRCSGPSGFSGDAPQSPQYKCGPGVHKKEYAYYEINGGEFQFAIVDPAGYK